MLRGSSARRGLASIEGLTLVWKHPYHSGGGRRGRSDSNAPFVIGFGVGLGIAIGTFLNGTSLLPNTQQLLASSPPVEMVEFQICASADQLNCVVDGDTIHLAGIKIRLEDIDAPEIRDYKCSSEFDLGERATSRLLELVNIGPFDVVRIGDRDADRFGRKLRTLFRNNQSLGIQLVDEGLAVPWEGRKHRWCG